MILFKSSRTISAEVLVEWEVELQDRQEGKGTFLQIATTHDFETDLTLTKHNEQHGPGLGVRREKQK